MKIAYFVHDLNDAAVARRAQMIRAGGAELVVLGFHRLAEPPDAIAGAEVTSLGRTGDARLVQRAAAVAANLARPARMLAATRGCTVAIGRNLEALALAARARRALPSDTPLIYECLDIHRLLLGRSLPARAVQAAEARLLRQVDLVLTSSPAFARDYFARRPLSAPVTLLENKLLSLDGPGPEPRSPAPGPPWRVAWFGNLRCAKTFAVLSDLVARHEGRLEVEIAGRPSPAVFPDFERAVAAVPHFRYRGPYRPPDLPALYARCHFAWAIDYFEEGLNSSWLLPNRLYEASSFGVVPIALRSVETGRWLEAHGAGVRIDAPDDLDRLFANLDMAGYARLREAIAAIPRSDLIADETDCRALVAMLDRAESSPESDRS